MLTVGPTCCTNCPWTGEPSAFPYHLCQTLTIRACGKCKHQWFGNYPHVCPPTFEEQQAAIRKLALSQATIEELLAALEAKGYIKPQ